MGINLRHVSKVYEVDWIYFQMGMWEVDDLSLSLAENRRAYLTLVNLEVFEPISKSLKKESTTISDVRGIFNAVIEDYFTNKDKISANPRIVQCPDFESGIVKAQRELQMR